MALLSPAHVEHRTSCRDVTDSHAAGAGGIQGHTLVIFTGYLSDLSEDTPQPEDDCNIIEISDDKEQEVESVYPRPPPEAPPESSASHFCIHEPPPLKHHCLEVLI